MNRKYIGFLSLGRMLNWFRDTVNPYVSTATSLPVETVPKKQVRKCRETKGEGTWIRIYGDKEEPLIVASATEIDQFKQDRGLSSSIKAFGSVCLGLNASVWTSLNLQSSTQVPSDLQLKQWILNSSLCRYVDEKGVIDFSPYQHMATLDATMKHFGTQLALTSYDLNIRQIKVTLPKRKSRGGNDRKKERQYVASPRDPIWPIVKEMWMHNMNHELVLHRHPLLHVIAGSSFYLARMSIPDATHPIRRLLDTHAKYTDAITSMVLDNQYSILSDHVSAFSPFDTTLETDHSFDLQPSHKTLEFSLLNPFDHLRCIKYGRMMCEYRTMLEQWISHFLELHYFSTHQLESDTLVQTWWKRWRQHFGRKHFTPWKESRHLTKHWLVQALTSLVFSASIEHSSDHWLYAQIPYQYKSWRWRGQVPINPKQDVTDAMGADLTSYDVFQEEASNHMFFTVNVSVPLAHVVYEGCPMDNQVLKHELERIYGVYNLVPPDKISCSIDW